MDRNTIIAGFSLPALLFIWDIYLLIRGPAGEGFFATGVQSTVLFSIICAVVATIIVGITLYVFRARELRWWHGLLISLGSMVVMIVFALLFGAFVSGFFVTT